MNHPTIWGHNCKWHHKIFNFIILNSLSITARCILWILGWKIFYNRLHCPSKFKNTIIPSYSISNILKNRNLICVSSHTSIWDGLIILLYILRDKIPTTGAAKYELFWGPFKYIFQYLGWVPIYWDKKTNTTEQIINHFRHCNHNNPNGNIFLGIFPEGSRWKDRWRSGFWHIAKQLRCNILTLGLDYEKNYIIPNAIITPSTNFENDLDVIKEQLYPFVPLYPEHTDLLTRYNDKKKLIITKSKNVIVIPNNNNSKILCKPFNTKNIKKISKIIGWSLLAGCIWHFL